MPPPPVDTLSRNHRWYFVVVGLFALWVGVWGYLTPTRIERAIPWLVPPLHARFLGAMYLSGAALLFGCWRAHHPDEVAIPLVMTYVWTAMLGLVSVIRLDEFSYRHQVAFWFFAYIVFPVVGLSLSWRHRPGETRRAGPEIPTAARAWLTAQGLACTALAATLFVAPTAMSRRWPWAIPPLLAHIYSGPFLSYGIGSLLVARHPSWRAARLPLIAMVVFAALVLIASAMHRQLFAAGSLSAVLWFAAFGTAVGAMAMTVVAAASANPPRSRP